MNGMVDVSQDKQTNSTPYSPEMTFLLAISSPHFNTHPEPNLTQLAKQCDEKLLIRLASFHNLLLLLKRRLHSTSINCFSRPFLDRLEQAERHVSFINLQMVGELITLADAANDQGITFVPFKGPTLAQRLYGDINLRASSDLDIATKPEDVEQAIKMLQERGYLINPELNSHQLKKYITFEHFISCLHPKTKIKIDLQWDFTNKYANIPFLCNSVKEHLIPLRVGTKDLMVLNNEACFVQLCIHAASHCWEHLEFTTAVAHLLASNTLDTKKVFELADRLHTKRMVLLGLELSSQLYGIKLQQEFNNYIKDRQHIRALANKICHALDLEKTNKPSSPLLTWRYSTLHIRLRDSFIDRATYLARLLFRPTIKEYEVFPHLSSTPRLYYCLRPPRLIWETIKKNRPGFERTQ